MVKLKVSQVKYIVVSVIACLLVLEMSFFTLRSRNHGMTDSKLSSMSTNLDAIIPDEQLQSRQQELVSTSELVTKNTLNETFKTKEENVSYTSAIDQNLNADQSIQDSNVGNTVINNDNKLSLSHYQDEFVSQLPKFSEDESEFILSSLIERSFDSFGPYITTFFLSHHLFTNNNILSDMGIEKVSIDHKKTWRKFSKITETIEYEQFGQRSYRHAYTCKISNSFQDIPYIVDGVWLPNRLSTDTNSNRRVDILRCPIKDSINATKVLMNTNHEIHIELYMNSKFLVSFTIPWLTRRTGYLLDYFKGSTKLNSWGNLVGHDLKDTNVNTNENLLVQTTPVIHLCMPGTKLLPTKRNVAIMLEYISHHLMLGFHHIYLAIAYNKSSKFMRYTQVVLKSYINEGKLSIISQTQDQIDSMWSVYGLSFHQLSLKIMQSTMLLYYTKGFVDYLAVFDIDELFIPKLPYNDIISVLRDVDVYNQNELPLFPPNTDPLDRIKSWNGKKSYT